MINLLSLQSVAKEYILNMESLPIFNCIQVKLVTVSIFALPTDCITMKRIFSNWVVWS